MKEFTIHAAKDVITQQQSQILSIKGDVLLGQFLHVHTHFKFLGNLFFLFTLYQFMKLVESILQGDTVIATETVKDTSDSQLLSKTFKKGLFGGSSFIQIRSEFYPH